MKPTQGRIVLYTDNRGDTWPAIVVRLADDGCVGLSVFYPSSVPAHYVDHVPESATSTPGCWHWPPRAPA